MKNYLKVIILFTDGIYNVGIRPSRPLRFIKRLGVKVHVVSVPASAETGVEHEFDWKRYVANRPLLR